MSGHYITWRISPNSVLQPDVTIECREPADANCRTECGTCEYWRHDETDRSLCGNCGQPLRIGQECNALLFIDGDVIDSYGGPEDQPVRDGLVEVEWQGEDTGYTWYYPEPDTSLMLPIEAAS